MFSNRFQNHYHPNVVRLFGFFEQKDPSFTEREQIGYVMEFMTGGSLHSVIHSTEPYDSQKIYSWTAQAGRGLQYLHEARVIHRDIKPQNMLLDRTHDLLKLSDFGLAKKFDATTFTAHGTCVYMAPELLNCLGEQYSCAVDVYSLAISIWEMIYRTAPYKYINHYTLSQEVVQGRRPEVNESLSPDVRGLIVSSWSADPSARWRVMDIVNFADEMKTELLSLTPIRKTPAPQPSPINTARMAMSAPFQRSPDSLNPVSSTNMTTKGMVSKTEYVFRWLVQTFLVIIPLGLLVYLVSVL